MIGPRIGPSIGPAFGPVFSSEGAADPMAGVSKDLLSGVYCPASAAEWTTTIAAVGQTGTAVALQLCQEASGDLADTIASMTLTSRGAVRAYQDSVPNWTRKAAAVPFPGGVGGWDTTGGPDASATSIAALVYMSLADLGTERTFMNLNEDGTYFAWANMTAADKLAAYAGNSTKTTGTGTYADINAPFPVLYVIDRANGRAKLFTSSEVITLDYTAVATNGLRGFGGGTFNLSAAARYLYAAWFSGTLAAWMSTDANAKALLQRLAWTVTGY